MSDNRQRFRVGLVGTGGIARAHGQACAQLEQVDLCAVHDVSAKAMEAFGQQFGVERHYLDLDQMLEQEQLDIAVICTWGAHHAANGIQLANSGKVRGILCEKPITLTAAEYRPMAAAAQEQGVLLAEAFKFRHHPMHLKAKELIEAGVIGEVLNVRSTFCTGGSGAGPQDRAPASNWRFNKAKGGGSIYDLACYNIHHARFIFGADPVRLFATGQPGLEVDDGAFMLMEFPGGGTAQITVGFNQAGGQYAEISGRGGMLRLDRVWNNENSPVSIEQTTPAGTEVIEFAANFQFALQLEHMCQCLATGQPHRISAADSLGQMHTIDAIYESMATGRSVDL
ncbi:MAG: hypothetical protein GKR89_26665 [Candidatus Latescibacteria bacterium]|nr:hypothetical protein [Candidatus Latescibacterota bacterium]